MRPPSARAVLPQQRLSISLCRVLSVGGVFVPVKQGVCWQKKSRWIIFGSFWFVN